MYQLNLQKGRDEAMKVVLNQTETSVGRAASNDVCLPDAEVSRVHFIIHKNNSNEFVITDKSTNGTFVNKNKISSYILKPEDCIEVGLWTIFFSQSTEKSEAETQIIQMVPTKVVSFKPDSNEVITQKAALKNMETGEEHALDKDMISIGKATSNDIVLDTDYISNFHCKIENRNSVFFLKDLNSTNGTFINNNKISETALKSDSIITLGKHNLKLKTEELTEGLPTLKTQEFQGISSQNEQMQRIFALIQRISHSDATVLIQGETGTGKELVANALHKTSTRSNQKYVTLNCGAIAKDLIESELFGHEKGAFTSALSQRKGVFEEASYGTLFLDEIGELPIELQPKLLRVLENKEIRRVGSNKTIAINTRVIAATHQNLHESVKNGTFREDLYYRLFVVPIHIPPLRERLSDIPLIVQHFLTHKVDQTTTPIDPAALELLQTHHWPGNIRELKNVINRAQLEADKDILLPEHINFSPLGIKDKTAFDFDVTLNKAPRISKTLRDVEREIILDELNSNSWNKTETAKKLGIAKSTLHEKIKKYDLD